MMLAAGMACAFAARPKPALKSAKQLVVVTTANWSSVPGTLRRYERKRAGARWEPVGEPIAVVVGKAGLGWGDGAAVVAGHAQADPVKQEGDGRSPAGIFRIGSAFGYAAEKPAGWALPYLALTPATECVDDRDSKYYNRIVERSGDADWKSSEHMRDAGVYYEWGAVIEQNPEARPGDGSCVFLHISDGSGAGTEGCTAMAKPELEALLGWLRPKDQPLLVEMPIAEYRQAEKALRLPSL
jgi:D-alanyl-D-alanine dipeptidase